MSDKETLENGFSEILNSFMCNVHTIAIGQVISYDATKHTIKVQPCFKRKLENGSTILLPLLEDVRVLQFGNKFFEISFELLPGDHVILLFSERALDAWGLTGGIVDPANVRKFDLSDAIAIPIVMSDVDLIGRAPTESNVISIRNKSGTGYLKMDLLGNIEASGTIKALNFQSVIGALLTNFITHTHSYTPPATVTGPPTPGSPGR